jgi:hypothetical protein
MHTKLVTKSSRKKPFQRLGLHVENNTEMGLEYIWFEDVDWIHVAQNRVQ